MMRNVAGRGGCGCGGGGGGGWRWLAGAMALLLPLARADVVFRVPEVLVRHAAASKPVGTGAGPGRVNTTRVNESAPEWAEEGALEMRYEEYFVEHDIATADARKAARALNLVDIPLMRAGCGTCSRRDMEYCESRVVADHCCCERRYLREPFPWLPHTCYVGPSRCRPRAGDCALYTRLRDCCCLNKLAERWKGILSKSSRVGVSGVSLLLLSMLLFVAYL